MLLLNFAGDLSLGALFENLGKGVSAKIEKGINPFEHTRELFQQSDLNIVNLECVFSSVSSCPKPFSDILRCPEGYIRFLKENHVHVVNLANNHTLDHGQEAFEKMRILLKENNILAFGEARDKYQEVPLIIEKKGKKIGFLGYYIEETIAQDEYLSLISIIKDRCKYTKALTDVLVLSLHWGHEYTINPMSWQIKLAKELIVEHGVDVLYGHHSHTLQGVVKYEQAIFAPSMGNFIFDEYLPANRKTGILQVQINNLSQIESFQLIPYYINSDFQPVPAEKLSDYTKTLNKQLNQLLFLPEEDLERWDTTNRKKGKRGHLINRLKIRLLFILNIRNSGPYLKKLLLKKWNK